MKRIVCGLIGLSLLASVNLMAKEVPTKEVNVSVGKDVSNTLSDYVHYTENKELYMKYFYYDKNGKKRDIKSPTLGQYEPTINEIKATESDFK
jgi:hypothetical protein